MKYFIFILSVACGTAACSDLSNGRSNDRNSAALSAVDVLITSNPFSAEKLEFVTGVKLVGNSSFDNAPFALYHGANIDSTKLFSEAQLRVQKTIDNVPQHGLVILSISSAF